MPHYTWRAHATLRQPTCQTTFTVETRVLLDVAGVSTFVACVLPSIAFQEGSTLHSSTHLGG